jgi:chromosome segregation ATPase
MTFLQQLPVLVISLFPPVLILLTHAYNPLGWIRNKYRDRVSDNLIGSLLRTIDERNAGIREKDRTIQCQRETIERLEHRVAADVRTIKGQLNFIKIKDKILVSKNRLTKELNDELVESDYHIRNLTWDIESLKAQIADKDEQLWQAAGRDCDLRTNLGRVVRANKILELTSEFQEATKCFVKQTADAREYRARMDEKTKDLCEKTYDLGELTSKLEEARKCIVKQTADAKESRALANEQANDRIAHLGEAVHMIKKRNSAFSKLKQRYDADAKAAVAEREDFQSQIRTLNNKVQECRGRMSTVNVRILDTEARLSSTLKEKEGLESKLKASTTLAQEKSMDLAFARHALDNAINQLKALNGQCNAHKLAKERFEDAFNASQDSHAETKASMQAQKESANRYAHQLLKTEERYKKAKALSTLTHSKLEASYTQVSTLQSKLETSNTQVSTLQAQLSTSNTKVTSLQEKLSAADSLATNLQEQYTTLKYTTAHLQDQLLATQTKTAAQDEELAIATSLATSFQERAAYFEHTAGNLEASLAAVQEALAKETRALATTRSDLVQTRRTCHEAQVYAASHAGDLGAARTKIVELQARVDEQEKACSKVALQLKQATNYRVNAVSKLRTMMALADRQREQKKALEVALGEEMRAREAAEGYVEVEGVVVGEEGDGEESGSDEEDDSEYENDGDDEEEEEDEKEEVFENVEVIEGRKPVEGEEGFEFVESE